SRLSKAASDGFWLTAFVARTQLVEFVLRENAYRRSMMAEIDPQYWIAPKLKSGQSFLEPMQGAHLKTMGVVKPWAPPRSYGLVIRLDEQGLIRYSLHSRFDGKHHGIVAAVDRDGWLYLLAQGPRRLLRLSIAAAEASLVPTMTVAQNLYLGRERYFNRLRGIYIAAQQFMQSLQFDVDPTAVVSRLGAAQKQMVEIARAVLHNAKVIIFDEPTASLTPE